MTTLSNKRIITAAVTGGDVVPSQSPHLPITPRQIADEAVRSAEAGAAVVHVHARDPETGRPSADLDLFAEILGSIRQRSDVVICPTTGGNPLMTLEERMGVLPRFRPEMATLNMGTMNYSMHFLADSFKRRGKSFNHDWEQPYLENSKDGVFKNSFADLEYITALMAEHQVKPEAEIYDLGMLYNAAYMVKQGLLPLPLQIQFVLGVLGGAKADPEVLRFLKNTADRELGSDQYTFSAIGAGYPQEFHLGAMSMLIGGNLRVGMEDNLKLGPGEYATSNAQLVEKAVTIARSLDFEPATPDETRRMLGLRGGDTVNF